MHNSRWYCHTLLLAVAVWLSGSLFAAQDKPANTSAPSVKIDEELRKELLRMTKEDQDARRALIEVLSKKKITDPKVALGGEMPEGKRVNTIDQKNTARMKEIVDKHGWPGKSLVGVDGANAAWLLVQHADKDRPFQDHCLTLMREAFKKGVVSGQDLAYLTDRVLVGQGKKQIYGTQFRDQSGKMVPEPIEDEAKVDQRRKEVGLPSMAEYEKLLRQVYKMEKDKK